jgi:hypothetical protein
MMDGRINPQRSEHYYCNYNYDFGGRYYHSDDEAEFEEDDCARRRARQRPNEGIPEEKSEQKESMSSWLGRVSTSSQAQFAATAIVSGAVVAGAIFGYQAIQRQERIKDLKSGIPDTGGDKVGLCSGSIL